MRKFTFSTYSNRKKKKKREKAFLIEKDLQTRIVGYLVFLLEQ